MNRVLKSMIALMSATLIYAGPAYAETPIGVFQTTDRKMDYLAELCGRDETQLCVTLTDVRGSAATPRTERLVGRYVVDHAQPSGANKWRGTITVGGYTVNGTVTLQPGRSLVLSGCAYVVVCQDFRLIPAQ